MTTRHGMAKIFNGVMKYRRDFQRNMVEQFVKVRDNPVPTAVFFSCVDSRVIPSRFTQTQVGDMFTVRNAGNQVPHSSMFSPTSVGTEAAVLELACVMNTVEHVVVCGHSDCKAMNLLYTLHTDEPWSEETLRTSPLRSWLASHGTQTIKKYAQLEQENFRRPLMLHAENPNQKFPAYVDVDEKYNVTDKLSMVNTLVQMQNVTSYPFMKEVLADGRAHIHAMWFDVYTGELLSFSRKHKTFIEINDSTIEELISELDDTHAKFKKSRQMKESVGETLLQTARTQASSQCQHGECSHPEHQKTGVATMSGVLDFIQF